MARIWTIIWKEIRDNLRDKRSLFFALVYGPLLMPALTLGPMIADAHKDPQSYDSGRELHVHGSDRAPNLMQYLKSKNKDAKEIDEGFKDQITNGDVDLVLEISEGYGKKIQNGLPAKVIIHYRQDDQDSRSYFWQIRDNLQSYSSLISSQRMIIRGFDQDLLRPLNIEENDLSEEELLAGMLANMIAFVVVISCVMGGFYLAIDITAGERERNSLEPLLSLPLAPIEIAVSKYFSVLTFMLISLILPLISCALGTFFLPDSFFGDADVPKLLTWIKLTALMTPIAFLLAACLMVISVLAKSTKEAQTQLGFATFFAMAPFFMIQFMDIKSNALSQAIPLLGQYLLANKFIMDVDYPFSSIIPSALSSMALTVILLALAVKLYKRDEILGG